MKVLGCGLCGSDIVKIAHSDKNKNIILGHEVVGEIVKIKTRTDFKVGDVVVLAHHVPCLSCVYCKNGNFSMCEHFKSTNIFPCGFSEKIFITEEHLEKTVFKVPNHLSNEYASFFEPLSCCLRAIRKADLFHNSKVLIIGLGTIGNLMSQALIQEGHSVFACDLLENRVKLAEDFSIEAFLFENDYETSQKILEKTGKVGVDCVFLTSGAKTFDFAFKCVRNGGKIVVFCSVSDDSFGFSNNEIYYRDLTVLGSYSPGPEDLKKSIELLRLKKIRTDNLLTSYKLENLEKAIEDTVKNKIMKAYIKL